MIPGGQSVASECWALLAVVLVVFLCRIASRRILLGGFKKFQVDDYLMGFNIACYIIVIFSIWVQCIWGNNYVTPEDVVGWTKSDFHQAIEGSKWGVAMETCKITCVWGCKACLLILYANMTKGLPNYHRAVLIVAIYVATGYILVMLFYFAVWCRPFHYYYDVIPLPDSQAQCMTYRKHMIFDACFNITSDAVMLCLPIPLVIRAQVPLMRKLSLVAVFSLGFLVILCAILNRVTNFIAPYGSLIYLNWYAGEASTAVIVANVPHLWPLTSRIFNLGSFKQTSVHNGSNEMRLRSHTSGASHLTVRRDKYDIDGYIPASSEERITFSGDKDAERGHNKKLETTESSDGNVELHNRRTTRNRGSGEVNVHSVDLTGTDARLGGWESNKFNPLKNGQIVKTIHIDQYSNS